jgi:uncharacterized protein (TIRG00374 family)
MGLVAYFAVMFLDRKKNKPSTVFRGLAFVCGLTLFYFSVSWFGGLGKVANYLQHLGVGYGLVVTNSFIGLMLFCRAWYLYLEEHHHHLTYWKLLKVRLCSEAVDFMTPLGFVIGDPMRVVLLRKYLGISSHLRSVVIDRITHLLAAHLFCLIGTALLLLTQVVFPLWLAIFLFALYTFLFSILSWLVVDMVHGRGLGFFEPLITKISFINRFPKVLAFLSELREDITFYSDKPKGRFIKAFFIHFLGRCLGAVEIALILYLLGGQVALPFAFMLGSLSSFFGVTFAFIPGSLGVLEVVYAQFFVMNGFSPELGLSIQVVRRLRAFFWVVIGIFILDYKTIVSHWHKRRVPST